MIQARLRDFDQAIEEAARPGARQPFVFFGDLASHFASGYRGVAPRLTLSFDDLVIASFVSGPKFNIAHLSIKSASWRHA